MSTIHHLPESPAGRNLFLAGEIQGESKMPTRKECRELAQWLGCSISTVYRYLKKWDKLPDSTNQEQIEALMRKMSSDYRSENEPGYDGVIQIYSNAILKSLVNTSGKNNYVRDADAGFSKFQYMYRVKGKKYDESLGINIEDDINGHHVYFQGITFREQVILSAIYSQISVKQPEKDGRYKISIRSIYEFINGKDANWSRVSLQERGDVAEEIRALIAKLYKISGVYTCKPEGGKEFSRKVDFKFFLNGGFYKDDTKQKEEMEQHKKENLKNFCYYCQYPEMMALNRSQGRVYRIPDKMLKFRMSYSHSILKIYLAYRVVLGNEGGNSMKKTIRYDEIERKCGSFDRDAVKRYMKYLETSGYVKNVGFYRDAVRWEEPK